MNKHHDHRPSYALSELKFLEVICSANSLQVVRKHKNVHEPSQSKLIWFKWSPKRIFNGITRTWKVLIWHHFLKRSFYQAFSTFISKCVCVLFFGMWWCLYLCVCVLRLCSWCDLSLVWADRGRHNRTPSNNRKSNVPPWAISLFTEISSTRLPKQTLSQTIASISSLLDDGLMIQNKVVLPEAVSSVQLCLIRVCVCVRENSCTPDRIFSQSLSLSDWKTTRWTEAAD